MKRVIASSLLIAVVLSTGCRRQDEPATSEIFPPESPQALTDAEILPTEPEPAPAPPIASEPVEPEPGERIHVVRKGQTLWQISGMYYGKSSQANVRKIADANPGLVPDRIKVGQKLVIPQ